MATDRRGQALVELMAGLFALALVIAALCGFSAYIVKSLNMRRELRARAGRGALNAFGDRSYSSAQDTRRVNLDQMAAEDVFGSDDVKVHEEVHIPAMGGIGL